MKKPMFLCGYIFKHVKPVLLILNFQFLILNSSQAQYPLQPTVPGQKAIRVELPVFKNREFVYAHQLLPDSGLKPEPLPKFRSKKNNKKLFVAQQLLKSGKTSAAESIAKALFSKEPENIFVLKLYGDILLKSKKRKEARRIYDKLWVQLYKRDKGYTHLVIDLWFKQTYWDLGCLYVENADWVAATEALSFALMTFDKKTLLTQQEKAFEYLAKAYFNLGNFEQAKYFADIVLIQSPENKEVLNYIKQ